MSSSLDSLQVQISFTVLTIEQVRSPTQNTPSMSHVNCVECVCILKESSIQRSVFRNEGSRSQEMQKSGKRKQKLKHKNGYAINNKTDKKS